MYTLLLKTKLSITVNLADQNKKLTANLIQNLYFQPKSLDITKYCHLNHLPSVNRITWIEEMQMPSCEVCAFEHKSYLPIFMIVLA